MQIDLDGDYANFMVVSGDRVIRDASIYPIKISSVEWVREGRFGKDVLIIHAEGVEDKHFIKGSYVSELVQRTQVGK